MRQLRLVIATIFLLTMGLMGSAFADSSVTMYLSGVSGNNGGGVYTYPYNFTVDGNPASLICDTFDNEVYVGETWKATVSGLLSGAGLFGSNLQGYEAAGLIFENILSGNIDATEGNWAIWGLFSQTAQNNSYYTSSGASGLAASYLSIVQNATPGQIQFIQNELSNLVLYTPIDGSQSQGGTPQEYIGVAMPEPGTIAFLIITLLFGAGVFGFRKKLGVKYAVNA